MEKLLIVDGHSLLFQSFYGMPHKIQNKDGKFVEAVICFMGILFKTIKLINPDKLLVVFDGENYLERQDVVSSYKSNRIDYSNAIDQDNPFIQLEIIKTLLDKIGFKYFETTIHEADDLIASIVNDYQDKLEIVISSSDKDFYQLISDKVSVFTYRGKVSKLWTTDEIKAKYGFSPAFFPTFKALSGDNSDNIKGLKGVGNKTATSLISSFGNLSDIYLNLNKLQNQRLKNILIENKDVAYKNYSVVNLLDVKNLFTLPDCSFSLPQESTTTLLKKFDIL